MKFLTLFLAIISFNAQAASSCDRLYPYGKQIEVPAATELCNTAYVSLYDTKIKGVRLTSELIAGDEDRASRVDTFRADHRLKSTERAELSDYVRSKYDRGHMAPANDMSTDNQMRESFLLSNMTPQDPKLNRGEWRKLEQDVKRGKSGIMYILTSAEYGKSPATIGANKIPVPIRYYKCVWYVRTVSCYKANNKSSAKVERSTLKEMYDSLGIKLL